MNLLKPAFYFLALLFIISSCKKESGTTNANNNNNLHVLGYLYSDYNWNNELANIDLGSITDLNLAFVNPDADGHFPVSNDLFNVVQSAHNKNVKIYMSIGGGDAPAYYSSLLSGTNRAALVESVTTLVTTYNFDGVDVDLEGDLIDVNYAAFINELSASLKANSKLLSAALATWNSDQIADTTLQRFDFINIMSYDATGPWDPSNPGQHSPLTMAKDDFNYFHTTRNIPAEKLFIGLPFYGYGFGTNAPESLTYNQILQQYPGSENQDEVDVPGGGKIYYNGRVTIHDKVAFALENHAGGVMIWELHQDTHDSRSLLKVINDMKK
jgi:chitinase